MTEKSTFDDFLQKADQLSIEDQEVLVDILNHRLQDHRRMILHQEI